MATAQNTAFESRVAIVPFSTCHYWAGEVNGSGYGVFRRQRAHRVAFEAAYGAIPADIHGKPVVVRHKCDTPLCVNPDHLEIGTQADNMADMVQRGRARQGEAHANAKLTKDAAQAIMERVASGAPVSAVAREFGVSPSRVSMILHGKTKWVGAVAPTGRSDRQISDDAARAIYAEAHSGLPAAEIAARHGVSKWMVYDIRRGVTYASVTGHRR